MSEETEVKNIEWLKNEVLNQNLINKDGYIYAGDLTRLLNQLDEPETLFVDKEQLIKRIENYIPLHDKTVGDVVEGILEIVKQLPVTEVLSHEWIDENQHPYGGDYHVPSEKLEEILVLKQEERVSKTCELKPVVPQFVADHIEEVKASGDSLDDAYALLRGIYHQSKVADWMAEDKNNSETFARAWLDGYEVEEEQKYYVKDEKGNVLLKKVTKGFGIDDRKGEIVNSSNVGELSDFRLTEKEIKDYDPRYMVFAKPIEELEE